MTTPLRVLIVDDQAVIREGLSVLLGTIDDFEVIGTAGDGQEAIAIATNLAPDVVLMDLRMPVCDGVEATKQIRTARPETEVVVLTTFADDASVLDALRAGARGFLTKDAGASEIARALQAAAAGQSVLDSAAQSLLLHAAAAGVTPSEASASTLPIAAELPDDLTPREAEVLKLIAAGKSNREIAAELVVSEATVKTHVNHLFSKTGARDRAQAVKYAFEHGLSTG